MSIIFSIFANRKGVVFNLKIKIMLVRIRVIFVAVALLWVGTAGAQSFLESVLAGVVEGLTEAGRSVTQSQSQSQSQRGVVTKDNLPQNSMVCSICKGTRKCPCGDGTISVPSLYGGRRSIQCPNCHGTLVCAGCHGQGWVPLGTGGTSGSSSSYSSGSSRGSSGGKICRLCNGTGKKIKEYYSSGQHKWCETCKKEVVVAHYHVVCDLCGGDGIE